MWQIGAQQQEPQQQQNVCTKKKPVEATFAPCQAFPPFSSASETRVK